LRFHENAKNTFELNREIKMHQIWCIWQLCRRIIILTN